MDGAGGGQKLPQPVPSRPLSLHRYDMAAVPSRAGLDHAGDGFGSNCWTGSSVARAQCFAGGQADGWRPRMASLANGSNWKKIYKKFF
jgi:hypothetical protein